MSSEQASDERYWIEVEDSDEELWIEAGEEAFLCDDGTWVKIVDEDDSPREAGSPFSRTGTPQGDSPLPGMPRTQGGLGNQSNGAPLSD